VDVIPTGLLPEGTKWCIAGGFAACPALAGDVDVWVYGVKHDDVVTTQAQLIAHIEQWCAANNVKRPIWPEKRYCFEKQAESREFFAYGQVAVRIEKIGVLYSPRSARVKPIHLMVTDAYTPGEIVRGFDISTHAVAIDSTGRIWKHDTFTAPHQPPAVLTTNEKTAGRYSRICQRFGHQEVVTFDEIE
jgi:hypothetical protein